VGAYLGVHEGPQRIAPGGSGFAGGDEPLVAGMILSNEPGYYKAGAYGIRIENLVLVEPREIPGAEKTCLGFETLTFAPIDRTLVDNRLLSSDEALWLDDYHAEVARRIAPLVPEDVREWLLAVTAPVAG
ncbi:MAG: M24 family metallopeptidase, partial [Sphingomonadales bacterium]